MSKLTGGLEDVSLANKISCIFEYSLYLKNFKNFPHNSGKKWEDFIFDNPLERILLVPLKKILAQQIIF